MIGSEDLRFFNVLAKSESLADAAAALEANNSMTPMPVAANDAALSPACCRRR